MFYGKRRFLSLLCYCLLGMIPATSLNAGWSPPERLTINNGQDVTFPGSLSIDGSDLLYFVWLYTDPIDDLDHVMAADNQGSGWNDPTDLTQGGRQIYWLDATSHINGSVHVVWQEGSTSSAEIWYATDQTGSWQIEPITSDADMDIDPSVAVDGYGRPHVTWIGENIGLRGGKIFYASRSTGGGWSIEMVGESNPGFFWEGAAPKIDVSETGTPYITYRGNSYGNYDLHLLTKAGSTWALQELPTPNHDDYNASIRVMPGGAVHIASSGNDGFGFPSRIYYNVSTDGGTNWQGWDLVSGTYNAGAPVLALTPWGEPQVMWEELTGNFYTGTIYHTWRSNDAWLSEPLTFDSASYTPSTVADGSGGKYVVYYSNPFIASDSSEVYYLANSSPTVSVSLTPPVDPQVSPGGELTFSLTLTNHTATSLAGDLWLNAFLVGTGAEILIPGSLLNMDNPMQGILGAGETIELNVTLGIPSSAPDGLFHVIARVGNFNTDLALDEARFIGLILP